MKQKEDTEDMETENQSDSDSEEEKTDIFGSYKRNHYNSDNKEESEDEFWPLLIDQTVKDIEHTRLDSGGIVELRDLTMDDLTSGKHFDHLIKRLMKNYDNAEKIVSGSNDIMEKINECIENYEKKLGDKAADFEEAIKAKAWKKYKDLIRKKVLENENLFALLIPDADSAESDAIDSEQSDTNDSEESDCDSMY